MKKRVKESVWSGILDRGAGEIVRKEDEVPQKIQKVLASYIDMFASIAFKGDYVVDSWPDFKAFVKDYRESPRMLQFRYNMEDLLQYAKDHWEDVVLPTITYAVNKVNATVDDIIDSLKDPNVNESTWGEILDRGAGETVRKEDELTIDDIKYDIKSFVERVVYYEQYKNILYDFERFCKERWFSIDSKAKEYVERKVDFAKRCWGRVKNSIDEEIDSENEKIKKIGFEKQPGKTIDDTLDTWWADSLDESDRMDVLYSRGCEDNYVNPSDMWGDLTWEEKMTEYVAWHPTNESVWEDMLDRGTGEKIKKEDDMNSDDFLMLRETAKMFKNILNRSANEPWSDTCDDFIKYINLRKKEHFWNDMSDEAYDKVIKFVKDNWGDCTGIQEFIDKCLSNINECEGVPGGATPASVGGMGAAYFPGPDGTPGSGDLPSPTGIVYHQVAPYTMFLKQIKKKKKKSKKFRKEDEPCVHSPNAKVYDYVDDFREYVDRTYNNIDRRK